MFKEYLCLEIKENILAEGTPLAKLKFQPQNLKKIYIFTPYKLPMF